MATNAYLRNLAKKLLNTGGMNLLKIAIPSYKSREAVYLIILTGLLVIRTYMSIWLADVNG